MDVNQNVKYRTADNKWVKHRDSVWHPSWAPCLIVKDDGKANVPMYGESYYVSECYSTADAARSAPRPLKKHIAVRNLTNEQRLKIVELIAGKYDTDEHLGDTTERFETILWIISGGKKGTNYGHQHVAKEIGIEVEKD
jgi:hypothetical protein